MAPGGLGVELREVFAGRLARFDRVTHAGEGLKGAAVVITLIEAADGTAAFLLTRRSRGLRAHSGQWALPGGRIDPGETPRDTALRELAEELGVVLPPEAVIGMLDDYPTRSGYAITPVVAWAGRIPRYELNPEEVASVHEIPLEHLARPEAPEFARIPESDRPLIRLNIAGTQIHAPTAAMLYQFRETVLHDRPTRVVDLEQPVWAWR